MKLIDGKLYLTITEAVECGIASENYIRKAKSDGVKCWDLIDDPADKRRVLVGYDELNDDRKGKVEKRYGNPYDMVARNPIKAMVVNDRKANEYYMGYRYDNGLKSLPINRVYQYTRAASWLNMLAKANSIRKELRLSNDEFYEHAEMLINVEKDRGRVEGYAGMDVLPADFPGSYSRLLAKVKRYQNEGYDMLIDPLFGNKIGAKLGKIDTNSVNKEGAFAPERYEDQMAVIRYCSAQGNNFDAGQVARMANVVFEQKGWKTISRATISKIISENMHLLTPGRQGKRKYDSSVAMQVKRKGPERPMMYWTEDGWTVELMFQERGAKGVEYKRLVAVIVLDAFNKYPIGYAIGERETAELIREANKNALVHVKELLGDNYTPWQVQSDNYQIKNLTPFYQAMTHLHTPAAVGNAKAKIVEPYFMYLNKNYCQLLPNWTGFNLTSAKDNQVNIEKLNKVKNLVPDRAGVVRQIEMIIAGERKKKVDAYMAGWQQAEDMEQMPPVMNLMNWLDVFGEQLGKRTSSITGQGIIKQINNVEYTYDCFDPAFRDLMHLDWTLKGDMRDLSKVLAVSPDKQIRFVLEQKRELPMDARSHNTEDWAYLGEVRDFNKENVDRITDLYGRDAERVEELVAGLPWETDDLQELAMKAMFTIGGQQKEGIQNAKRLGNGNAVALVQKREQKRQAKEAVVVANDWERMQDEFLSSKTNFNQYE